MPAVSGSPSQIATAALTPDDLAGTPDDAFADGDLAFVASLRPNGTFQLNRSLGGASDGVTIIDTFTGQGRWELLIQGCGGGGGTVVDPFVQPAVGAPVTVATSGASAFSPGQVLLVPGVGWYRVVENLGGGAYVLLNIGGTESAVPGNTTITSRVYPMPGPSGEIVASVGVAYVQPPAGQTVNVTMSNADWITEGQIVFVSVAGVAETGGFYLVTLTAGAQVSLYNLGTVGNAAPAANIPAGAMVVPRSEAVQTIYGLGLSVMMFGAVGDGVTDDGPAIQRAIDAVSVGGLFAGATLLFPPNRFRVTTTLTIGGVNNPVSGPILQGTSRGIATGARCSLVWGGNPGGVILLIRNAHSGKISEINFDGDGSAGYCLQARHAPGDLSTTERWMVEGCRFEDAVVSNVLLGDTVPSQDDCSAWTFINTFFGRGWSNTLTDSHVTINAWNSFGTTFVGCQWYGTNVGGAYYPLHAVRAVGGNYSVFGGATNALGQSDFYFVGDAGCQPSGATIVGVESQSYRFLEANIPVGTTLTPQWSVTVVGGYHTDSSGAGSTESINWNVPAGFMPIVLHGFRPQLNVNIGVGSKVFVDGVVFTGIGDFTGDVSNISGNWYVNAQFVTSYSGVHRRNLGSYDQTYGLGGFQTYASLCPQGVGLGNGGTWDFAGAPNMGLVLVTWDGNPLFFGAAALFLVHAPVVPGTGVSALVSDPSGTFSATAGNPGTINLFWNAGTQRWRLQNNLGGGTRVHVAYVGVGPT